MSVPHPLLRRAAVFAAAHSHPAASFPARPLGARAHPLRLFSSSPAMSAPYAVVATAAAPKAIGPYSQAIKHNGLVYTSGAIGFDPATMEIVAPAEIEAQAEQMFKNLGEVLKASGSSPSQVLKTTVFIKNMNDFVAFNGVYAKFFGESKPARSTVEVARLPKDALVEIETIAIAE